MNEEEEDADFMATLRAQSLFARIPTEPYLGLSREAALKRAAGEGRYLVEDDGPEFRKTDFRGPRIRISFDGTGRVIDAAAG